jgi:hypothetical protein
MRRDGSRRGRSLPFARGLLANKPLPVWEGKSVSVKFDDWAEFATANHLQVIRSWIADEHDGKLDIIVEVKR